MEFGNLLFDKTRNALCVGEVAEKLNVTPEHIQDLIAEGKIAAINIGGGERKHWRVPVEAYEKFLRDNHSLNHEIANR